MKSFFCDFSDFSVTRYKHRKARKCRLFLFFFPEKADFFAAKVLQFRKIVVLLPSVLVRNPKTDDA